MAGVEMEWAKVGKHGAVILPSKLRERFGMMEGTTPIERYTPERKAEFLLSNAIDEADYRRARKEVLKLGIDPDSIPHRKR
jgi:bifunctional DNA-binding transcriptional regulator/antitoxin component of YhaV-PrlF toxin-antitoxin module